jgi:hypothetical protein
MKALASGDVVLGLSGSEAKSGSRRAAVQTRSRKKEPSFDLQLWTFAFKSLKTYLCHLSF